MTGEAPRRRQIRDILREVVERWLHGQGLRSGGWKHDKLRGGGNHKCKERNKQKNNEQDRQPDPEQKVGTVDLDADSIIQQLRDWRWHDVAVGLYSVREKLSSLDPISLARVHKGFTT